VQIHVRLRDSHPRQDEIAYQKRQELQVKLQSFDMGHGPLGLFPGGIPECQVVHDNLGGARPGVHFQIAPDMDTPPGLRTRNSLNGVFEAVPVQTPTRTPPSESGPQG
jgi:hypothetical protein